MSFNFSLKFTKRLWEKLNFLCDTDVSKSLNPNFNPYPKTVGHLGIMLKKYLKSQNVSITSTLNLRLTKPFSVT